MRQLGHEFEGSHAAPTRYYSEYRSYGEPSHLQRSTSISTVDIIIDQLEYMTRDLHLIQVPMTIMDTIIIHPIALMIVCTIKSSVTTIKVRNLNQI